MTQYVPHCVTQLLQLTALQASARNDRAPRHVARAQSRAQVGKSGKRRRYSGMEYAFAFHAPRSLTSNQDRALIVTCTREGAHDAMR
jgi:hypothetical protein